jgi:fluoroquinolone transport system ATP-binding protein
MQLLELVGLHNDADKKVINFSKGMKMRLGFIRSILHDPKLLFLDEPTSGLDPANARTIKDMILEQKRLGKTVILTTHNMHDAEELCDRVAFIVDGEIKALDAPLALRKHIRDKEVKYAYSQGEKVLEGTTLLSKLHNDKDFIRILNNGSLTSIHSKEQTLEDVFIELTGRCLH